VPSCDDRSMDDTCGARLRASLDAQRRHALGILEGLDDADLRRAVLPSGWSCAGLVQHLAVDVEQFWFTAVMAGDPDAVEAASKPADGWTVPADRATAEVLHRYRSAIDRADAVIDRMSLDDPPAWWPTYFGSWRLEDLEQVLLHVITETACHAGHLDAARELIDGRQWFVQS